MFNEGWMTERFTPSDIEEAYEDPSPISGEKMEKAPSPLAGEGTIDNPVHELPLQPP